MIRLFLAITFSCGYFLCAEISSAAGMPASKTFSVTVFGAKGDGVADDAPAIQRALDAAAAHGGRIAFPCGTFNLKSVAGAAPGARSVLYLKASNGIELAGKGACSHLITTLPQKSVLEFDGSTQISVCQLRITALNARYVETYGMDGGSAIRFTGVSGGSIHNVEIDGASAGALYLTAGTSGITVEQNNIHDTYGSGTWEDDCGGASATSCAPSKTPSNNIYDSNTFTNVSMDGGGAISIDDGNGVSNALIRNNIVSWTRPTIATKSEAHCIGINNVSNVNVLNNQCDGTPWDAIVITTGATGRSASVVIRGNTIRNSGTGSNSGSGIVVYDAPRALGISGFIIDSNTITKAGDDGIRVIAASKPGNVQQGQVTHNVITLADQRSPGSHFGIDVEYSSNILVDSNIISCTQACLAAGIRVSSSPGTTPTKTSNQISNILGTPLLVQ